MKYLYIILFMIIFLPANAKVLKDSSIYVVKGNVQKMDDELIVSFLLSIDRELSSNESVVLEPIILNSDNEVMLPKIYVNSRKQQIMVLREFYKDVDYSNSILRKNGTHQNFQYLESIPYSEWMESASLVINEESCGCGLPISSDIVFTSSVSSPYSLPEELPKLAYVMPEETELKLRTDKGSAYVLFQLSDTIIKPKLGNNQSELDKITNSIDIIKNDSNCIVTEVCIHGYASPEGPYKTNVKLARGRTNAVKDYISNIYQFSQGVLKTNYTAEDWLGFEAIVENSSYKYRNEILKIIRSELAPDKKEQKIRTKYPQYFKTLLADWLPILRHTEYTIQYEVCLFNSIEEIEQIFYENPKYLSLSELFQLSLYYKDGSEQRNNVIMQSVQLYPDSPIANLNAACVTLRKQDIARSKVYIDKSLECPEKDLLMGVYCLLINDYANSEKYLNKAKYNGIKESEEYIQIYESINK